MQPPRRGCTGKRVGLNFESLFSKPASLGCLPCILGKVFRFAKKHLASSLLVARGPAAVHRLRNAALERLLARSGEDFAGFFEPPKEGCVLDRSLRYREASHSATEAGELQYGARAEYFSNESHLVTAMRKKEDAKHNEGLNNPHNLRTPSGTAGFKSKREMVFTITTIYSSEIPPIARTARQPRGPASYLHHARRRHTDLRAQRAGCLQALGRTTASPPCKPPCSRLLSAPQSSRHPGGAEQGSPPRMGTGITNLHRLLSKLATVFYKMMKTGLLFYFYYFFFAQGKVFAQLRQRQTAPLALDD